MKLNINLKLSADISNPTINDVRNAIDERGWMHTNQYLQPEGGLYDFPDYVTMLCARFGYTEVTVKKGHESILILSLPTV